jgi:hypothetical protein
VDRPEINYNKEISKTELSQTEKQEYLSASTIHNEWDYSNIEGRNIFSPDGSYKFAEGEGKLNYEPYRFIGVIESGQKRAVFMKEKGGVITLKIGDRLEDEAVISSIENLSVKLEKDEKVIEHKIFKLENE